MVSLLARKEHPELKHPQAALAFVPDEEITTAQLFWTLTLWCCVWVTPIDGGPFGEFCYETFNAAEVFVRAHGLRFTRYRKNRMTDRSGSTMRFHELLPLRSVPSSLRAVTAFSIWSASMVIASSPALITLFRDHRQRLIQTVDG